MPKRRRRILEGLAARETRLLETVRSLRGTIGHKTARLRRLGVFDAYAALHCEYVDLAAAGDEEGLKRALFLQWFEVAEPPFLTGIVGLHEEAKSRALALADRECQAANPDAELMSMLQYYYLIADYFIPSKSALPALVELCERHPGTSPPGALEPADTNGRGQMGDYWASIRRS